MYALSLFAVAELLGGCCCLRSCLRCSCLFALPGVALLPKEAEKLRFLSLGMTKRVLISLRRGYTGTLVASALRKKPLFSFCPSLYISWSFPERFRAKHLLCFLKEKSFQIQNLTHIELGLRGVQPVFYLVA